MAFNPNKKPETKNEANDATMPGVEEGLESALEAKESLDFLLPKKDAVKDSMNDPYNAELTQKSAYQYTLKTLNALKIVSPIISALMQRPGVDAPNEEMSESFRILISETSAFSVAVCEKLGIDPNKEKNFWIRNVLEKSISEILHNQWVAHGKADMKPIEQLIDDVVAFNVTVSEKSQYDDIPEESLVKLAGIKAMLPILSEANEFNLYRDIEKDIEPIMTKLFDTSAQAVTKLADDYANEKDRSKIFYMIMQEAGLLYAASWKCENQRISNIMKENSPEKMKAVLEKYQKSGGFPLTKIEHDFDKYFNKMVIITEKLVSSQKGTISKRLKMKEN